MLYLLFFLSGISGLIYQVVWVRQFGNLFGNTVYSAALVTSVFMLGLGVGSYFCGKWADRAHEKDQTKPLLLYGYFEFAIAAFGLVLALVLPHLEWLSSFISSYVQNDQGWYVPSFSSHFARYFIATLLIAPITFLMGGTLTLLIRFIVTEKVSDAGKGTGLLYGINTAGAAMGCFLVDFYFIPNAGIFSSELFAIFFNLLAGWGAIKLYRASTHVPGEKETERQDNPWSRKIILIAGSIFIAGFVGMSLEMIWFRFLSSFLGNIRTVFSMLLTIILIGIWLGAFLGGWLAKNQNRAFKSFVLAQVGLVGLSALLFWTFRTDPGSLLGDWVYMYNLERISMLVFLPALLMGATFPLANGVLQDTLSEVGQKSGLIYLINTVGATLGSLVTGFVLLPKMGMQDTVGFAFILILISLSLLLLSTWTAHNRKRMALNFAALIVVAIGFAAWKQLDPEFLLRKIYSKADKNVIFTHFSEDINDTVAIAESKLGDGSKILYVDGKLMSGTTLGPQRYMRAFSHFPLLHLDFPKKALVICFGVGNTVQSASLHPTVDEIHVADLSENVLRHASHFKKWNRDILKDPRVQVYVNDGRQHLRTQNDGFYDLITLEPPPIATAGMASLYSKEFYELAKEKLADGGFITQWLPIYQVKEDVSLSMIKAFVDVYPNSIMLSGFRRHLILMGRKSQKIELSPADYLERLSQRPEVEEDMRNFSLYSPLDFFGSFVANVETLKHATRFADPVTDDYPSMEYSIKARYRYFTRIPADVFDTSTLSSWCPQCFAPDNEVELLDEYLQLLGHWYRSDNFLMGQNQSKTPDFQFTIDDPNGDFERLFEKSPYLRYLFPKK